MYREEILHLTYTIDPSIDAYESLTVILNGEEFILPRGGYDEYGAVWGAPYDATNDDYDFSVYPISVTYEESQWLVYVEPHVYDGDNIPFIIKGFDEVVHQVNRKYYNSGYKIYNLAPTSTAGKYILVDNSSGLVVPGSKLLDDAEDGFIPIVVGTIEGAVRFYSFNRQLNSITFSSVWLQTDNYGDTICCESSFALPSGTTPFNLVNTSTQKGVLNVQMSNGELSKTWQTIYNAFSAETRIPVFVNNYGLVTNILNNGGLYEVDVKWLNSNTTTTYETGSSDGYPMEESQRD